MSVPVCERLNILSVMIFPRKSTCWAILPKHRDDIAEQSDLM